MRIFPCICALGLSVFIGSASTYAQQGFSIGAEELLRSAGASDDSNPHGVSIQLEESTAKFDAANRLVFHHHLIYRIDSSGGVDEWSTVSMQWSPWHQKRPAIRARVITPDGVEHLLDPKTLSDAPANDSGPEVFGDDRIYSGPLPAVKIGSVVERDITVEDTEPFFSAGIVRRFWFGGSAPIAKVRVIIEAPVSLHLKYEARLLPKLSVGKEQIKRGVRLTFEQTNLPVLEDYESNLPSDISPWPYLVVSTAPSWQAIAVQYNQTIEKQIASAELKTIAAGHAGSNRMETIRNLSAYLHDHVRYTGIEFGEGSLVPRKPEETFREQYGDCKDKAAALVALLRAAGIRSYLALLSTGPGLDVDSKHPGLGMFNHAIVYVPGTPDVWIDATDKFRTGGLPYSDQGRNALVISPDSSQLLKTPEASSEDNLLVEHRLFELPEFGAAKITEVSEPHGSIEAVYRELYGGGDSKETRQQLEAYVKNEYLADSLAGFEPGKGSDMDAPFRMKLEVAKGKRGFTDLGSAVAAIRFDTFFARFPDYIESGPDDGENAEGDDSPGKKKVRTSDVVFEPFILEWHYRVTVPPGFQVRSLPANHSAKIGPAQMTQRFETEKDGSVIATLRIDSVRGRYTASEALVARKAIHDVQKADPLMIVMEPAGEAALAAGNIREALAAYRDLAAKYPKEGLPRVRLSRALLIAGLGERSRQEAREAIELLPNSAIAHRSFAWILQHDLIGRRFKKGFDFQGAEAELRKAHELDPADTDCLVDLAILLEHDAAGERYTSKSRLNEAIATYREIEKISKNAALPYADSILFNLIYSRQFNEVTAMLAELPQTQQRLAIALASIAAVDGSVAAIQRSLEISRDTRDRKPALKVAATILRNMHIYQNSAELAAAAAEGEANAAQALGEAQGFRNTKPFNSVIKADDPRSAIQRLFVFLIDPTAIDMDPVHEFGYIMGGSARMKEKFLSRQGGMLRFAFESSAIPRSVAADLIVSNLQMGVEGDDRSGYCIRVQSSAAEPQTAFIALVDGKYRIMGMGSDVAGVGVEVLRQIQAGDLAIAKQWLDRVRDVVNRPGGDDPFAWPVFPALWKRGDAADSARMRKAALSLIANTDFVKPHLQELKSAQGRDAGDGKASAQIMLLAAYRALEQWSDLRDLGWKLLQEQPTSSYAFAAVADSSLKMKDPAMWEKAITLRLNTLPEDHLALSSKGQLLGLNEKFAESRTVLKKLIDSGKAVASDMNQFGWSALFTDKVEEADIEIVQRASGMTQNTSYAIVHTLACLYAEIGKTKEAYELLLHTVSLGGLDEPDSAVWYGLGRLAEQYGERTAALAAYRHMTNDGEEQDFPTSTWSLAQKRILGLKVEMAAGKD